MKILHTSDWHLGRTLHGHDLHEHHAAFHEELLAAVTEHEVDVVIIAGDVYDRAIPPVQAVQLLSHTLARLADVTTVILTPGNHDSAARLGFGRELMRSGVHVLTDTGGIDRPVTVHDRHGQVLFFGLPYLEPDIARFSLADSEVEPLARSHEAVTRSAMARINQRIAQVREAAEGTPFDPGSQIAGANGEHADASGRIRTVVIAHTFVAGGQESESERDLTVGGVDSVPGRVFAGVDYVALGHLHGCQNLSSMLGQSGAMWYSGSPLPYSISEKNHAKSMLLIDMEADGSVTVQPLPVTQPRRIVELRGSLNEVLAQQPEHGQDWVAIDVTDRERPAQLIEVLRRAFPHLLTVAHTPPHSGTGTPQIAAAANRDPMSVMTDFLRFTTGNDDLTALPERDQLDPGSVIESAYGRVRAAQQEAS